MPHLDVRLTADELALVCNALDSHVYWQLSEPEFRSSGLVSGPGSDEPDDADQITAANTLLGRLGAQLKQHRSA